MRCTKGLAQGRSNLSSVGARPWREAAPDSKARLSERQTAQSDGGDLVGLWLEQGMIANSFIERLHQDALLNFFQFLNMSVE